MLQDLEVAYPGYHDYKEPRARARLRIYEEHDELGMGTGNQVVIYSDPEGEYVGLSPTNGAERIATIAAAKLAAIVPFREVLIASRLVFVEYYAAKGARDETFDFAWFKWIEGRPDWWVAALGAPPMLFASQATWHSSSRKEIEVLIGVGKIAVRYRNEDVFR